MYVCMYVDLRRGWDDHVVHSHSEMLKIEGHKLIGCVCHVSPSVDLHLHLIFPDCILSELHINNKVFSLHSFLIFSNKGYIIVCDLCRP